MIINWYVIEEGEQDKVYALMVSNRLIFNISFRNHYGDSWQVSVNIGSSRNFLFDIKEEWNKEKFIEEVEKRLLTPRYKKVVFDDIFKE